MRRPRLTRALLATAASTASLLVGIPAASAHVACDSGEFYRVAKHNHTFIQVDSVQLVNKRSRTATLSAQVGESHTSSRSFSTSISASAEAGFWDFAKATASSTIGHTIESSTTMSKTYTATVQVPGHSTRTVAFGFRRYNQDIQEYHWYNNSMSSCARHVDRQGWVRAPYQKAFVVS